jgi:hypothetical protein
MMQLGLLDYVVPPEQTVPTAPSLKIGDSVRVVSVGILPESLIGQIGTVSSMLLPTIAQVEIEGQVWGMERSQLELVPPQVVSRGAQLWQEAVIGHRDQTLEKLKNCPNADLYKSVISELEALA